MDLLFKDFDLTLAGVIDYLLNPKTVDKATMSLLVRRKRN